MDTKKSYSPSSGKLAITSEVQGVIKVIRSLVISRKQTSILRDIIKEYKELEGRPIPFRDFGFQTLNEFLLASNEFKINDVNGEAIVQIRPNKESDHMMKLVQRNKPSKKTRNSSMPFNYKQMPIQNNNRFSAKSLGIHYTRQNSQPLSNNFWPQQTQINSRSTGGGRPANYIQQQQTQNTNRNETVTASNGTKLDQSKNIASFDLRSKITAKPKEKTLEQEYKSASLLRRQNSGNYSDKNDKSVKPIMSINNNDSKVINLQARLQNVQQTATVSAPDTALNTKKITKPQETSPVTERQQQKQYGDISPRRIEISIQNNMANFPTKRSLQDRLKIHRDSADEIITERQKISPPPQAARQQQQQQQQLTLIPKTPPLTLGIQPEILAPPSPSSHKSFQSIDELKEICNARNIPTPTYKFLKINKSDLVQCCVTVNKTIYSSYPDECKTEIEAQMAAASKAISQFRIEAECAKYPICLEPDYDIAFKILEILRSYPHGIFDKNLPTFFQTTYQMSLPEYWSSIIIYYPQFFTIVEVLDNFIVYANVSTDESSSDSATSETDIIYEKITLPWNEKHWNLYVSNPSSTTEIWGRIIGAEYSDKMDALITDIELSMLSDMVRPMSITCGQIYLVSAASCWYRVRVNLMDFENNRCMCFFIDVGEEEWYPMDQLYVCESKFLKLPAQAVQFSLYGLEDFEENPYAKQHLDSILAGKIFVGEIVTKQEDYEMQEVTGDAEPKIKVVLFDTSSQEDLNLNPLILNKICEDTPPPQLERTTVTHVNVTYISDNGDIYCQIKNNGLYYIQRLISSLVENDFNRELHRGLVENSNDSNQRYLIFDKDTQKWYRATHESTIADKKYVMYCIDFGFTKTIANDDCYRLDSLNLVLNKFPAHAVKCRLYGIPHINESTVARTKGLLNIHTYTIVKVMIYATVPQINVYQRFEQNGILFCVNETIRLEQELERTSDILKSSSPSPNNSRQNSSCSMNRNTQSPLNSLDYSTTTGGTSGSGNAGDSIIYSKFKNIDLKSQTATAAQPKSDLPKIKNFILPNKEEYFNIFVTMTSNPTYFVVQPYDDRPRLHAMMRELQSYCANNKEFIPSDNFKPGQPYAALHSDGNWHRAIVERIYGNNDIHVCFCDYGEIAVISSDKLKTLPLEFRKLPKQAIKAKLHGIKPKYVDWTPDDCVRFNALAVDHKFASIVKNVKFDDLDNEQIIELVLIDVSSPEDVYIHNILIEEDRAVTI